MTKRTKISAVITAAATILCTCSACANNRKVEENVAEVQKVVVTEEATTAKATTTKAETKTTTATTDTTTDITEEETTAATTIIEVSELSIAFDMDVTKTSGLSKHQFIDLVKEIPDYAGYYKRNAPLIWELSQEYNVNEIFICGLIASESGWAQSSTYGANNYFGWRSKDPSFATEEEGLEKFYEFISKRYLSEDGSFYNGPTLTGVGKLYCPGGLWADGVYGCMQIIASAAKNTA